MNFNKKIWLLIFFSSALRILVAASLELGNDEVYYQTYAQFLQWNYFDHPPMLALLIRLTTFNLYFHNELFIRAGAILCAALGTWLMYKTGCLLRNQQTGWFAAILYNTSLFASVIAGTFILPDAPQTLFWLISVYLMIRILDKAEQHRPFLFIMLGFSIGLCIMSKVHGIFLWLGFGAYIIFHRRDLLKSPYLWIAAAISLAIISPIYFWNRDNHFITYTYHQGRISFWGNQPDPDHFLQQLLGSFFYSNPVNFIIYSVSLYALAKGRIQFLPRCYSLLLWLSVPLIGVLLWTSIFNEILPHWSGPAYFSLMLLAAIFLEQYHKTQRSINWLKTAGWVYGLVVIGGLTAILFLPFRIGNNQTGHLGKGDITLDMSGWKSFATHFDSLYETDSRSGKMKKNAILISDYWFPAGHLEHYEAIPHQHSLLAIGSLNNIHHFAWLNARAPRLERGADAYFIYPSNYYGPPAQTLKNDFGRVEDSVQIPQYRAGQPVRYFVIYRMHDFKGDSLDYLFPGIR